MVATWKLEKTCIKPKMQLETLWIVQTVLLARHIVSPNPPFSHDDIENELGSIGEGNVWGMDLANNSDVVAITDAMIDANHRIQDRIITGTMRIIHPDHNIGDIRYVNDDHYEYTEFGWVKLATNPQTDCTDCTDIVIGDVAVGDGNMAVDDNGSAWLRNTGRGVAWTVTIGDPDSMAKEKYHKCDKCYEFSMVFGGSHTIVIDGERIRVDSEESFETMKGYFVKHWNKEHRDLINKRRDMPKPDREFKKGKGTYWSEMDSFIGVGNSPVSSGSIMDYAYFSTPANHSVVHEFFSGGSTVGTPIQDQPNRQQHQQDQHVYEYNRRSTRTRNMDRHSRFREYLRNG